MEMTNKPRKVERWSYPFKPRTAGRSSDSQLYYEALARASGGFFPIAGNGLWHGGVHFDEGTAALLDQSEVRCIADGEVIAYRIDERYPRIHYGEGDTAREAPYSTGFVLVRHRLEPPPLPNASPAMSESSEAPSLIFYSLYMHLLDWQDYQEDAERKRPRFWGGDTYTVKSDVRDSVQGWRVRADPRGAVLGALPRGTQVEGGEWVGPWRRFVRAIPPIPGLVENVGYFYVDRSALKTVGDDLYLVSPNAKDPVEPPRMGLNVRAEANSRSDILAVLPAGTQVRIAPVATAGQYHKLLAILDGEAVPALDAERLIEQGYVWRSSLEALAQPKALGCVVPFDPPQPIAAGALIGHLGQYQAYSHSGPQAMLHLEVFSCQDVEAFVAQSRAHAARLPVSMKTLLKIPTGTKLIARDDVSPDNPPKISDPGLVTGHDMIFPLAVLDALPVERKIRVSETYGGVEQPRQWWKLDRMPGPDGNEISGWLCEIDPITTRHSPWEWEGFDFIKETSSLSDQYASHLSAQAQLDDDERARYRLQIDAGDSGPIRERLYDLIDLDRDQKLTPREIRTALEKPWIAQSLGRLITHYESEWYDDGTMSKWNALDGYMNEAGMADWEQEKQRIRSLLWWGELEGKQEFPSTGTAWHLQPTDLITLFSKKSFKFTLEIMRKLYPILSSEQNKDLQEIADELNSHIDFYKLDTHLRRAHFFAQILQETGPKLGIEEVFAYRQSTLIKKFEYFRLHPELALEHGLQNGFGKLKSNGFPMNQNDFEAIANAAYGERSELGNRGYSSGDGWKYRGRGLKQLTGRYNYLDLNDWHKKNKRLWPDDNSDFIENPDLLLKMKYATRSAAYFWLKKELYKRADTGSTPEAVDLITDIINRYTESRYLRKLNFSILWGNEVLK